MMTAEDFHEADIMWPDHGHSHRRPSTAVQNHQRPSNTLRELGKEEEEIGDMKMVPPHILVAQRMCEKIELSVCTGKGRTLKGRDQRYIRDAVLRMTGFLER